MCTVSSIVLLLSLIRHKHGIHTFVMTLRGCVVDFTNGGILSGYQSLLLHLSGTPSLKTGTSPLAVNSSTTIYIFYKNTELLSFTIILDSIKWFRGFFFGGGVGTVIAQQLREVCWRIMFWAASINWGCRSENHWN